MTSSFQVRCGILSREVGYLFWVWWTRRKVASDNNSRWICKQAIIKLSMAYSFRKVFFIGHNSKHVHMTYPFFELLVFFWWTVVDIYAWSSKRNISHHTKEILYVNTNFMEKKQSLNKNKYLNLFLILMSKKPDF